MKTDVKKPGKTRLTARAFEALPDSEKDRIYQDLDARAATIFDEAKPLAAWQKKAVAKAKKRIGRPRHGKYGTRVVSVTVEKELLKAADDFAKSRGLNRSEFFAASIRQAVRKGL